MLRGLRFPVKHGMISARKEGISMDNNFNPPHSDDYNNLDDSTRIVPDIPDDTAYHSDEPYDPLEDAQELPSLFLEDQEEYGETAAPTVVPRPVQKQRRRAVRICTRIAKYLVAVVLALAILAGAGVGYLTLTEYNPAYAEVAQRGAVDSTSNYAGQSLRLLSFNTGYGALGKDADFFMDGGKSVNPDSKKQVEGNMIGIEEILKECDADLLLLQEVDIDSDRSYHLNQWLQYEYDLKDYETRYAASYVCRYVPYPLKDMIGEVNSGVATYSRYGIASATRYSLPCPFSWPTRIAQTKRCMLVTRFAIENKEDVELVVINVHLEAYDDGEGKRAQTKQILDYIQSEYDKGNYVVVGGDFNQIFPKTDKEYPQKATSEWEPGKLDALPDDWQYAYDSSTPTCRLLNQPYNEASSLTQYYVIDGFLLSPNIHVDEVETLDEGFMYSDHNPVLLNITLE